MGPSRSVEDILTIITVLMSLVVVVNVPDHREMVARISSMRCPKAAKPRPDIARPIAFLRCRGTETGRRRFQSRFNLGKKASLVNFPTRTLSWWNDRRVNTHTKTDDLRVSPEEQSYALPCIANRSKRPNTSNPTGRHNVFTHFPSNSRL